MADPNTSSTASFTFAEYRNAGDNPADNNGRAASIELGQDGKPAKIAGVPFKSNQLIGSLKGGGSSIINCPTSTVSGGSTKTWGGAWSLWDDFNAVQLIFANHTATAATIDNLCVSASATVYPGGVNNIALPTQPWSTPYGAITVPASSGVDQPSRNQRPGYFITNKIPCRSVSRASSELDGGLWPLLFYRVTTLVGNTTACQADLGANFHSLYDPHMEGFTIQTSTLFGTDAVSNTGAWTSATSESTPTIIMYGVIPTYDHKVTCIVPVGDSIWQGAFATDFTLAPFAFRATARIKKSGKKVSYYNAGISGANSTQIAQHGKDVISMMSPDIMILHCWTINSPISTQANWDSQWYDFIDIAQAHLSQGPNKQVLMIGPLPNSSLVGAQNTYRLNQRARVSSSGFAWVDVESLADPSNGHFLNSLLTPDGTHLTNAGSEAVAALVQPVLDSMIP